MALIMEAMDEGGRSSAESDDMLARAAETALGLEEVESVHE